MDSRTRRCSAHDLVRVVVASLAIGLSCAQPPPGHDVGSRFRELSGRAERGELQAQFDLGYAYMTGRGTERDPERAVYWYRRAAEQGHRAARLALELVDAQVESPVTTPIPVPAREWAHSDVRFGDYYALLIGNNAYTTLEPLSTPVHDANALAGVLSTRFGFHTEVLINATRREMVGAIERYRRRLGPGDNFVLFFAGHGVLDPDADEGYWLGVDADPQDLASWIPNATVATFLRAMPAKHVLVISDSCYAGTLTRGLAVARDPDTDALARLAATRVRMALTSGDTEPVVDGGGSGHSVFARYLIAALAGAEGVVDGANLYAGLRRPVMQNSRQTPQYGDIADTGHEGGDFLFVPAGSGAGSP